MAGDQLTTKLDFAVRAKTKEEKNNIWVPNELELMSVFLSEDVEDVKRVAKQQLRNLKAEDTRRRKGRIQVYHR